MIPTVGSSMIFQMTLDDDPRDHQRDQQQRPEDRRWPKPTRLTHDRQSQAEHELDGHRATVNTIVFQSAFRNRSLSSRST